MNEQMKVLASSPLLILKLDAPNVPTSGLVHWTLHPDSLDDDNLNLVEVLFIRQLSSVGWRRLARDWFTALSGKAGQGGTPRPPRGSTQSQSQP